MNEKKKDIAVARVGAHNADVCLSGDEHAHVRAPADRAALTDDPRGDRVSRCRARFEGSCVRRRRRGCDGRVARHRFVRCREVSPRQRV
jgi:hypothetical protein